MISNIDRYKVHSVDEDVRASKQGVSYCHVELEAHKIEWCKASDVETMYKDMCHELAIVMNELEDSEKALDELHEHL